MTPARDELLRLLDRHVSNKSSERHHTYAETMYWLDQYRLFADDAATILQAMAEQKPVAWHSDDWRFVRRDDEEEITGACLNPLYAAPVAKADQKLSYGLPSERECRIKDEELPEYLRSSSCKKET